MYWTMRINIERPTQCLEGEVEAFYGLRTGIDWKGRPRVQGEVGEEGHCPREPLRKAQKGLGLMGGKVQGEWHHLCHCFFSWIHGEGWEELLYFENILLYPQP